MKIEDQLVSLEIAKKLKELGVKQESYFYFHTCYKQEKYDDIWSEDYHDEVTGEYGDCHKLLKSHSISAFSVAELGDILPAWVQTKRLYDIFELGTLNWINKCEYSWNCLVGDKKEADARAKILIYLLENNWIKVGDL